MLPTETFKPAFKLVAAPFTVKPLVRVPKPVSETVNKVVPPLLTVKFVSPG